MGGACFVRNQTKGRQDRHPKKESEKGQLEETGEECKARKTLFRREQHSLKSIGLHKVEACTRKKQESRIATEAATVSGRRWDSRARRSLNYLGSGGTNEGTK